ncbi:MAG: VCBS repeat-containing protein, partial [Acidobacteriia bacterium]|nr:VCBS repeat-containing protein [Terriglobia bacterium]
MGPGCAFIDYDNDGNPAILLVNGSDFPGHKVKRTTLKLYHNNGNGTFTDVTARARLDVELYGMGAAIGDYDNDGWDDIYITGLGESRLFHNEHNGTFKDVTKTSGVNNAGYGASAAWVDYDKDG